MGKEPLNFRIDTVTSRADRRRCVELQREVWEFEDHDLVTADMLATCQRYGGTLLAAYLPDDQLVGFVFGIPGVWGDRRIEHSHMLAVRRCCRDLGIGYGLKNAQFERAQANQISVVTWTFDPLEAKNAHLNLNKLGVVIRHYYRDLYGDTTSSALHAGLGTDRFLAEAWLDERNDPKRPALEAARAALKGHLREDGLSVPDNPDLSRTEAVLTIEVPAEIQELKRKDAALAKRWRMETRKAFLHYLSEGYEIRYLDVERASTQDRSQRRTFYCLFKESPKKGPKHP